MEIISLSKCFHPNGRTRCYTADEEKLTTVVPEPRQTRTTTAANIAMRCREYNSPTTRRTRWQLYQWKWFCNKTKFAILYRPPPPINWKLLIYAPNGIIHSDGITNRTHLLVLNAAPHHRPYPVCLVAMGRIGGHPRRRRLILWLCFLIRSILFGPNQTNPALIDDHTN